MDDFNSRLLKIIMTYLFHVCTSFVKRNPQKQFLSPYNTSNGHIIFSQDVSVGLKWNIQYVSNNTSLVVTYYYEINDYVEYLTR